MGRTKDLILAAVLALILSFVLFGNGIGGDFVFDDTIVIVGNPFIDGQLGGFGKIFITPYFAYQPHPGLYRPLTIASYSLNAFVLGSSPVGFHVVNIFLHALTSFLAFVLLYRLSVSKIAAFAGFLFFMFLPIHTEAVTSIVGRAEILSLLFVIGALLLALKQRYIFASTLFFLGLLSKEMAVAFLPIFLFLELFSSGSQASSWKPGFQKAVKNIYYFIPSVIFYAVLRYIALGEHFLKNDATAVYNPIKFASFFSGLWTSFKVFYLYLVKTFFPIHLSSDYSFGQIPPVKTLVASLEAMLGIAIFCLVVLLLFRGKDILMRSGIIIFLSSYFVISNWVFKTGTIMAERLLYMPSLGLAFMIGAVFVWLGPRVKNTRVLYGCVSIILVFYGFLILDRNRDWLNDANLYESAYAAAPDSIVNQTNKAYLEFKAGKYMEAEEILNKILYLAPEHVPALNLAGQNYKKLGQLQKSEELWKKAIELRADYLRAYLSLGVLYYENGYFESAENVLVDSVDIYPRWSEVLFLALTKVSLEKPEEAIELIHKHFGDNPQQKELRFALGWAYFNKGDKESAYRYFEQVKDPKTSMEDFIRTFEGSEVVILGEF
ncbi:MAG: hypothetical protein A2651_03345 [Candidatus Yanofskybacteria bacterium RIFCSPHIGHO2_01_FULL_42_12]|uniref:Uncharacterized protein n=1 Tax=Candidatus Yanofskybacteria bacterium RIFCSPLOWO2_01_FULL_42_49 TaxID=1802694 RepID=A0A1F8GA00_9BACT|nr:MAG: hypothetical protein A2651_03345 [Candidatus Yanofskybacteria bacterium RIFCSPHIGHO2_01_FULL_42_12]OGN22195.1 MAG: hypothetical protein A2918_03480 [Candidatus Yanofskybacteria bacterium RIFCSPLOWO2_01_FULL_42_49]